MRTPRVKDVSKTVKLFMKQNKRWTDPYTLYSYLICQNSKQKTAVIRAPQDEMIADLHWGIRRVRTAQKSLVDAGLISIEQPRRKDGTYGEPCIKIK